MPSTILSDNGVTSGTAGIKTTGSNDGALALQTTTAGGAATTALTIDTNQNVGIGTSSPQVKLHVNGASSAISSGGELIRVSNTTGNYQLNFGSYNGNYNWIRSLESGVGGVPLVFAGTTEWMRIDSSGNVGIGTTSTFNLKTQIVGAAANDTNGGGTGAGVVLGLTDTTSFTTGVGGGIGFSGYYDATPNRSTYGVIRGIKENSTSGNYAGAMTFFTRANSANLTERARITSDGILSLSNSTTNGPYLSAQTTISVASGGTITLTSASAGAVLVCVYDTGSGEGGVFFFTYATAVTKIAGNGEATDTGGNIAVYKSSSSHTCTFKNRYPDTRIFNIGIYSANARP